MTPEYEVLVIGGGFYGCVLASHAASALGRRTALVEKGPSFLGRASYYNQARVHRGYHYPRSLLTASRSRANFGRFLHDFRDCVDDRFECVYAVSRVFSNVTASQYTRFCDRIGAPLEKAPPEVRRLFNLALVEEVFRAREAVFDAGKLRERLSRDLVASGAEIRLETEAARVQKRAEGILEVSLGGMDRVTARHVFDCTYSRINHLFAASGLPPVGLKHELAELAVVRLPEPLTKMGITVMCGPFFSAMPFPSRGLSTLSHVRYTPHAAWEEGRGRPLRDPDGLLASLPRRSRHREMIKDASRYLPLLAETAYLESMWEVKTLLPRSDVDDSRPILFKRDHGIEGLHCVMGSKIDNVYDMIDFASVVLARI
ncbi:MAG: FAD-dependent oxidoreductase [Vicinamibacteria bacterium]